MHRTGAPEGDQCELPGIPSPLRRHSPQGSHHPGVGQIVDATGCLLHRNAERTRGRLDGAAGQVRRYGHGVTGERTGPHVAQHHVGVGHRRVLSAESVGGRPRHGAGAAGTHLESAGRVDPGNASTTGADLGDVDARHPEQLPGAAQQPGSHREVGAHLVLPAEGHPAVLDQGRLGSRATHVEGDGVLDAELPGQPLGCHHSRRRTRLERVYGPAGGVPSRHGAAGRLHDQHGRIDLDPLQTFDQIPQVGRHDRDHVGVQGSCGGALVLVLLPQHLAGDNYVHAG